MGILIEVTSDNASPREWEALAAFVSVMQGKPALLASTAAPAAPPPPTTAAPVADAGAPSGGNGAGPASGEESAGEGPIVTPTTLPEIVVPEGVEVDTRSLPWDGRIHASTKTKVKSGEWTAKRNVDPELVKAVEAELFKAMSAPPAGTAPAAPPPPATGGPVIQVEGAPAAPAAPPPPATTPPVVAEGPAAAPPPPTEPAAGDTPFTSFMRTVVAKQAAGTVTTAMTNEIAASLGLTSIRDLANRPDLIATFEALLP